MISCTNDCDSHHSHFLENIHHDNSRRKHIMFRGGAIATSTATTTLSMWNNLTDYIGATRRRCWIVLGVAIIIEIASTTLLNVASQEKSTSKMALAMFMYMTRYVNFWLVGNLF
jgi:hypothetical protein